MEWRLPVGARPERGGVLFRVWAPDVRRVEVVLFDEKGKETAAHPLERDERGYFSGLVEGVGAGARYMYWLDGDKLRPDPVSRYQPESVHGPSQVADPGFAWTDGAWNGIPLRDMVIYETHVGTATPEGTFEALIDKLAYFKDLGVSTIEIMPVADFPGERNWGYDGVDLYAPARAYGGPEGLKRLIDAAHASGLAVVLDVVYNHLGPDGNYLRDYSAHYFTHDKKTDWGDAIDYANPEVRDFFVNNALYWAHEYHVDGLRLDATHAILDDSEEHILAELARRVRESLPEGRHFAIFSEDHRNDVRFFRSREEGGHEHDGVWADEFHHVARSALAGDNEGYYMDYAGTAGELADTLQKGWLYTGQKSKVKKQPRGTDASHVDPEHFVFCIQNHDQIGNRPTGDRLTESIELDAYRAASALLLLSPYTPLLFQGQEWAASTPFQFFTDHNEELGKLVTKGRREEFAHFKGFEGEYVPDPQAQSTFANSKLNWQEATEGEHAQVLELYRQLLRLRQKSPAMGDLRDRAHFTAEHIGGEAVAMRYRSTTSDTHLLVITNLKGEMDLDLAAGEITRPADGTRWTAVISSEEPRFGGSQDLEQVAQQVDAGRLTAAGPVTVALAADFVVTNDSSVVPRL